MALSTEQHQAIANNCLPMSWQMLGSWRLQHLGSLNDGPEVIADWLADAPLRSKALGEQMVRRLSERLWRVELLADGATASVAAAGVRKLCVTCGGQRWILWLQPRPQLQLLRIEQ